MVLHYASIGGGIDNAFYLPPATDNNYSGVLNLWFREAWHCSERLYRSTADNPQDPLVRTLRLHEHSQHSVASFTARFRNADGPFTELNGIGFVVQQNYLVTLSAT